MKERGSQDEHQKPEVRPRPGCSPGPYRKAWEELLAEVDQKVPPDVWDDIRSLVTQRGQGSTQPAGGEQDEKV